MHGILTCVTDKHDATLLFAALIVCGVGIYAASAIAAHAARAEGVSRRNWALISIVAAGCTAWATHMIALLAFRPGMDAGFEPVLTALSLLLVIGGIGGGMALSVGQHGRVRRFLAGTTIGLGIAALHYVGQAAYLITGHVTWQLDFVIGSVLISLAMSGTAIVLAGERNRALRRYAMPLLLGSIVVLHLCGMTAVTLTYDPQVALLHTAIPPGTIAPIMVAVSLALLGLAVIGLRMTLAARAQLRRDRERLRELASLALEGLAICDGDVIITANQSLEQLTNMRQADLVGLRLSQILPKLDTGDLPEREERDVELVAKGGQTVPVRVLWRDVPLGHTRQTVVAIRDRRESLRTEARIRTLAFSDVLTGLPNRARFNDLLEHQIAALRDPDRGFALLLVDLDRFKYVNDSLGHALGDELLRIVAARLRTAVRDTDVVARLGGDEFALLLVNEPTRDEIEHIASRVLDAIDETFVLKGQLAQVSASIGAALAPSDGACPETLLRSADLALYKAKAQGKATICFFEPELAARMEARRTLEADLRRALENDEFEVHYQPLVDTKSGAITAAEALVRWRHPERGLIPPVEFIPVAEETGLILELGAWVMQTACAQARAWPAHIKIAVNLSPVQFRDDRLPQIVRAALDATGLQPERLELEITESVMLANEDRTLSMLLELKAGGVRLSMDDFGTGYSSLSYLRRFPFDKIKIDRSFVQQLPDDAESAAIVRAIVTMGSCLGLTTTVEGVETKEQYAFAAVEQCEQVQGYLISRPLSYLAFCSFLEGYRAAA